MEQETYKRKDVYKTYSLTAPIEEIPRIVKRFQEVGKRHILCQLFDKKRLEQTITNANERGWLTAFYNVDNELIGVLLWSIAESSWWSRKRLLQEVFVLSMNDKIKGFQRLALEELDTLARVYDCKAIVGGNLLSPTDKQRMVENGYRKKQFITKEMFIKVLDNDE